MEFPQMPSVQDSNLDMEDKKEGKGIVYVPKDDSSKTLNWQSKRYAVQLMAYVDEILTDPEKDVYRNFFEEMTQSDDYTTPADLILLDSVINDFIRLKRVQGFVAKTGDTIETISKAGNRYTKVNDASYLIASIQTQIRANLRELMATKKERVKKQIGLAKTDFASFLVDMVPEEPVKQIEEKKDDSKNKPKRRSGPKA